MAGALIVTAELGAADYKLTYQASNGRAVYSFCMCPGGTVVAAASEEGRVVTNGMSQYSRDERNANSGIVVGITPEDYPGGPLAGVEFQRHWEERAFELGGGTYEAPGQLVGDARHGHHERTALGIRRPSQVFEDVHAARADHTAQLHAAVAGERLGQESVETAAGIIGSDDQFNRFVGKLVVEL